MTRFLADYDRRLTLSRNDASFVVDPGDVHVWVASVDVPDVDQQGYAELLCDSEKERASHFKFPKDRKRFVVSHGMLRTLIAKYLAVPNDFIVFATGVRGKPLLACPTNTGIHFNMSHSGDMAAFAFAVNREVGIDIEHTERSVDGRDIAERFFCEGEVKALDALSGDERMVGFYNCWTRKEAVIKAMGDGLFMSLQSFEVNVAPGEVPNVLRFDHDRVLDAPLVLKDIPLQIPYICTLATFGGIGGLYVGAL